MAKETIIAFQERLARDEALCDKLRQVQEDNGNIPVSEVIRIAGVHGYDFSLEDIRDALQVGELSDEELDQAVGGATSFTVNWSLRLNTKGSLLTDIGLKADKVSW